MGCYAAFIGMDATLVEINPLAVTGENTMVALDAKMAFDENALYRRSQISSCAINLKKTRVKVMRPTVA